MGGAARWGVSPSLPLEPPHQESWRRGGWLRLALEQGESAQRNAGTSPDTFLGSRECCCLASEEETGTRPPAPPSPLSFSQGSVTRSGC